MNLAKKVLLAVVLFSLVSFPAGASEILGQISTNPQAPAGEESKLPVEEPTEQPTEERVTTPLAPGPATSVGGGAVILPAPAQQSGLPAQAGGQEAAWPPANQPPGQPASAPGPQVLGEKIYADNALVRGPDKKIYLVKGRAKKYVTNLAELEKYRGRVIATVTAATLASYPDYKPAVGELIRQKGDVKVYAIAKGKKHHILNLEELRARYFGLEIFNLSAEEMALYP
jgi:hypothetical protein